VPEGFWGAAGQVVRYAELGEQVRREAPQAGAS